MITYTLTVSVPGSATASQTNVVVSDPIPGYDAGIDSAVMTYAKGSATCVGAPPAWGGCTITTTKTSGVVTGLTWSLGTIKPGETRQVSFAATADEPKTTATADEIVVSFVNVAAVRSDTTKRTPSNAVTNTATRTAVKGEEIGGETLPGTGPSPALTGLAVTGLLMVIVGSLLVRQMSPQPYQARHAGRPIG